MSFDTELFFKITGGAGGIIGTLLGIVNLWRAWNKEKFEKIEEENDFSMLAALMEAHMGAQGVLITPTIGSPEWKQAERLVRKGFLARGPSGRGYCIPGAFRRVGGVEPSSSDMAPRNNKSTS
jgi:hypothetical protein